jgi:hypothetical protein
MLGGAEFDVEVDEEADADGPEALEPADEVEAASGYSSMSFTTQSASVPEVEAKRSAMTSPEMVIS